jgi:hypothetical protein
MNSDLKNKQMCVECGKNWTAQNCTHEDLGFEVRKEREPIE